MNAVAVRFGRNLLRCRRSAGLSQERLAAAAGMHRTEVGYLEHGQRCPRIDTLVKLACALTVPTDELLDGIAWVPGAAAQRGGFSIEGER